MEVVGLIASSVTLLEVSLETVGFFQEMATIQDDFRCLQEVVADIDSILQAFHSIPSLFAQGSGLPQVAEPTVIARAVSQLERLKAEMDEITTYCARSPGSDGVSDAKKRRWVLKRNRIPKLLERARDARSNFQIGINFQLMTLNAFRVVGEHRAHLEAKAVLFQELRSIQQLAHSDEKGEVQEPQVENKEEGDDEEDEDADEDSGGEITQHSNSPVPSIRGLVVIGAEQSYPICQAETAVTVRTQRPVSQFDVQRSSRIGPMESQPCHCRTKRRWNRYQTPVWLWPIIGKWDVHHSPGQDSARPRSSNCSCHSTESLCLNVEGLLPAWIATRTLLLKVAFNNSGLALALRPAGFIDLSYPVYSWAVAGARSESFWSGDVWAYFPEDHIANGLGLMEIAISHDRYSVVEYLLVKWQSILQHRKLRREVAFLVYDKFAHVHLEEQDAGVLSRVLSFVEDAPVWGESTLVHAAVRKGHGINEALDKEPWALNEPDYTGEAPIHAASRDGNKSAVQDLIQANASVNEKDFMGRTALMLASLNGHVDCVRLLLRHSDIKIEQRDIYGCTAISLAAKTCDPEVVAALLEAGASVSARGIEGDSPLHYLGKHCRNYERIKQTLQLFLASGKITIDALNGDGVSPLMFATGNNRLLSVRCLVEAGASMQLLNEDGRNMLHMAANCDLGVLQYLLSLDPTTFRGISPSQPGNELLFTPWDDFLDTLFPSDIDYREESSHQASEAAFDQLLHIAQDENLQWEINVLESTLTHVRQSRVDEARSRLNSVVIQRERWKDDESAGYYRGISQQIQAGDFERVTKALEEDIEDLHGQIGSSPWRTLIPACLTRASGIAINEEEDEIDGGEDGDDAYETAESGDEAENEDTGTAL